MMSLHTSVRKSTRPAARRLARGLNRPGLRGCRRGPDDWSQAFTAFRHAIRAHRRLARLAPAFFDSAVVDRAASARLEQRRWRAIWEPALAGIYGAESDLPHPADDLPPLPPPRRRRVVERELAGLDFWLAAGRAALDRRQSRHPHAVPGLGRVSRLLNLARQFQLLAGGQYPSQPPPATISFDHVLAELERAYAHRSDPPPP